jgi:hypothetical protein
MIMDEPSESVGSMKRMYPMAEQRERRIPARRARQSGAKEPMSFKDRLAKAATVEQATDDGYLEIERDDRLDYLDMPMILDRWEVKEGYNGRRFARVWAVVQMPDRPDPMFIKFRDMGGEMGEQLDEFDRCGTHRNVAVRLLAREYTFNGGLDVGYAYTFGDYTDAPPVEEPMPTDEPEEPPY